MESAGGDLKFFKYLGYQIQRFIFVILTKKGQHFPASHPYLFTGKLASSGKSLTQDLYCNYSFTAQQMYCLKEL